MRLIPALLLVTLFFSCKTKETVTPPPGLPPATPFRILDSTRMVNDLQAFSSDAFRGRKAGLPEVVLSHQLIQSRLRQAGVDSFATGFEQPFTLGPLNYKNFLGLVKGTAHPDQYIVVGGHFDHLGVNGSGVVYHGADDNASGAAATLAMAAYFQAHKPAYSIIFALWDAEELGLKGSDYFVNNLPSGITLPKIRFNLNMDMIARADNNTLWACGLYHFPSYQYLVDSVKNRTSIVLKSGFDKPTDPQDWTYLSDQGSFFRKGIPFLYLGVEDHPDYHKTSDTFDKVNLNRFVENANIVAQMALLLDRKL